MCKRKNKGSTVLNTRNELYPLSNCCPHLFAGEHCGGETVYSECFRNYDVLQTCRETTLCVCCYSPSVCLYPSFPCLSFRLFSCQWLWLFLSFCHSIFASSSFIVVFRCPFWNLFYILFTSSLSCFLSVLFSLFLVVCQISSVMSLFCRLLSVTPRLLFPMFTWRLLLDDSGLPPSLPRLPIHLYISSVPSNPVQHKT